MSKYKNIKSEHQLRSLVFDDYFKNKDVSWEQEIESIDFIITDKKSRSKKTTGAEKHYIWMETKKSKTDYYIMLVQLLLTIKKPYDKNEYIVPNYIGCFDTEQIVFVPMKLLQKVMHENDIKWNITPSNTKDEYFLRILNKLKYKLHGIKDVKIFFFGINDDEIKDFIQKNVYKGVTENKFQITEHNFDRVYLKWVNKVKPFIAINWEEEKKYGFKLIVNTINNGPGGARNLGVEAARGEYIIYLDGDDTLYNNTTLYDVNDVIGKDRPDVIYLGYKEIGGKNNGLQNHRRQLL